MSTTPHRDDENNPDRNHGDHERARIENAAAQLRVPVATIRYWHRRRLRRADRRRSPGSGPVGS